MKQVHNDIWGATCSWEFSQITISLLIYTKDKKEGWQNLTFQWDYLLLQPVSCHLCPWPCHVLDLKWRDNNSLLYISYMHYIWNNNFWSQYSMIHLVKFQKPILVNITITPLLCVLRYSLHFFVRAYGVSSHEKTINFCYIILNSVRL